MTDINVSKFPTLFPALKRGGDFIDYPRRYYAKRFGLHWHVCSIDTFERVERREAGPFWRELTALRIARALTQHYRDGWDSGARGYAVYGGGRVA